MAIPRDDFYQSLYKLLSTKRICGRCNSHKAIKNRSEKCDKCGESDWQELAFGAFANEMDAIFSNEGGRLSEYLGSLIGKSEEWADARMKIIECLEGFSDEQTALWLADSIQTDHESVATIFDDFYTRDFLKKVENIVDRTMKLSAMAPKATPDGGVNLFLREASRCLIHGFWNSSVALSRAALELGLKHQLKSRLAGHIPTEDDLQWLLEYANQFKVIDNARFELGDKVRKTGNKVLHGSQADEDLAWETLWPFEGS
jgi:uncharacterized protein DUF4145